MIITDANDLRQLTASYYANSDFTKIEGLLANVEQELARTLGLPTLDDLDGDALEAARTAVAYMGAMRYYRLNDLSHETNGRKAKIDRENEARPFEWQLARDERAHLEEYYRALDRLVDALQENEQFQATKTYQRQQLLVVKDADSLNYLTGLDPSPWLYQRLIPFLADAQGGVEKGYGDGWDELSERSDELQHAAQKAVALEAVVLMGRRTQLSTLPYGMMRLLESDGGGNTREQPTLEQLDAYLGRLKGEQRYWLNEMKNLRDKELGRQQYTHLQMPDNDDPEKRYLRL